MLKDAKVPVNATNDLLGQHAAINTLVNAIERLPPPACIALYGAWGSGKTNILHNAMSRTQHDLHVPVWFDPWEYDQQPDLLGPLLRALLTTAKSYHGDPERTKRFKSKARRFFKAAKVVVGRIAARRALNALPLDALDFEHFTDDDAPISDESALQSVPEDDSAEPADEPKETAGTSDMGAIERWLDDSTAPQDAVAATKKRFAELVIATLALARKGGEPKPDRRVVFFLDDLDRCLPDRVVELVEQVKLLLCGSDECDAIFVFALDRRIVGEAIRNRFPGASQYSGENYLEKIFDFSMETPPLPAHSAAVQTFAQSCMGGHDELSSLCEPFGNHRPLIAALSCPPLANPRVIKRALNRLGLLLDAPGRRAELAKVQDAGIYERCLTWLAGAERFREFRHFVRTGHSDEVTAFVRKVMSKKGGPTAAGASDRMAVEPGMLAYLVALAPLERDGTLGRIQSFSIVDGSAPRGTLKWFDDLMRSAGL